MDGAGDPSDNEETLNPESKQPRIPSPGSRVSDSESRSYETLGAMRVPMIAASTKDRAQPMTHTPRARAVLV